MKKIIIALTAFISITLISCSSNAQDEKITNIESYLNKLEQNDFSGSVLVEYKGEKILSKGYGNSDKANSIENTPNTIFDIGSVTKQFTAAAILKLEMLGKLRVEDKIAKYFPSIPKDKTDITIHHLLTHSSGLVDGVGDDYESISEKVFLERVFSAPLLSKIGKEYHYSNVGYSLLAIIIEKVSGISYETFLNENLFKPAKMMQTGYTVPKWAKNTIAVGYNNGNIWGKPNDKNWDKNKPFLNLKGNGGILSSTEDMYKWHQALLDNHILDEKAKEKYYKPYIREGKDANSFYAYGWAILPTPRKTNLITHNGGNGIFFCDFWRYLDEQITIIVMTNQSTRYSEIIASQIAGIILKENYTPIMPNDIKENSISNDIIEDFSSQIFSTIRDGDKNDWAELIKEQGTNDFINMAPLETHLSFFKKFNKRLQGGKVLSIKQEDDETLVKIKTKKETFNMVLNVEPDKDGNVKLGGIMLD